MATTEYNVTTPSSLCLEEPVWAGERASSERMANNGTSATVLRAGMMLPRLFFGVAKKRTLRCGELETTVHCGQSYSILENTVLFFGWAKTNK
jgi:hypothetical protein